MSPPSRCSAPPTQKKKSRTPDSFTCLLGQVYASEAKADGLASWGRFQRQDPRMEAFDAKVFSSEAASIDGTHHQGTTEHNSLVHRKNGDGYGYLDKNTTALQEAALTPTGDGDRILPGERPVSPRAGVAGH